MQKGIVIYKLFNFGWDVSDHFGDGCDLIAEKGNQFIKIELKAIDLNAMVMRTKPKLHILKKESLFSNTKKIM